jgi:hypothetical protein
MGPGEGKRVMKSIHEKLIKRLLDTRRIDPVTKCWIWTGYIDKDGYGRFGVCVGYIKLVISPHRAIAYLCLGLNLKDRELKCLHKCDTPACWNPLHLFIGTQQDNITDMINKGKLSNQYGKGLSLVKNSDWMKKKSKLFLEETYSEES